MFDRRRALVALAGTAASAGLPAFPPAPASAQTAARPVPEFRRLAKPQPAPADRIEVLEFFFYPCPFCHELEPLLRTWTARQPKDVLLRKVPAVARDAWAPFARLFHALELLGEVERLHAEVYRAFHVEELSLGEATVAASWAAKHGIDRKRFTHAYDSGEVTARVRRAEEMTADYDVQATPSIVVDGRWLTSSGLSQGVPKLLPVVDRLIAMVREERAAR